MHYYVKLKLYLFHILLQQKMYMDVDFDTFEVIYEDAILEEFDNITTPEVFLNTVLEDEEKNKSRMH